MKTETPIADIAWITPQLATGGDFSYLPHVAQQQFEDLLRMRLSAVIDNRMEANDAHIWHGENVAYHHLPTDDRNGHHIPAAHFDRAVAIAREAMRDGGRVFSHCHMGVNRGPSVAFAILLDLGHEPESAFDMIRKARPQAGIYYAEDALIADMLRKHNRIDFERLAAFRAYVDDVFGPEERAAVNRHIKRTHEARHDELHPLPQDGDLFSEGLADSDHAARVESHGWLHRAACTCGWRHWMVCKTSEAAELLADDHVAAAW